MKISSRSEYGLQALLDLAQRYGASPATNASIAARQQIPEAYLRKLLIVLRRKGLVRSVRGPQGGHILARPPSNISLAEAVGALESSISLTRGLDVPPPLGEPIEAEVLREVWRDVEVTIGQVLESITLDDLCYRKLARERQVMYHI